MRQLDRDYPLYGLASHKGYSTPEHKQALGARAEPTASQKLSPGRGKLPALGLSLGNGDRLKLALRTPTQSPIQLHATKGTALIWLAQKTHASCITDPTLVGP